MILPARILCTVCLLAIPCLNAALEFSQTVIEQAAKPGDTEMTATFTFKNTGTNMEKIIRLESSCGCTVPQLEKRDYAPGESGEIKAVFRFEGRTGWQSKDIRVITESAPTVPIRLTLKTTVPEIFGAIPRMLIFQKDNPEHDTRSATLQLAEGLTPLEITAKPKDDKIKATLIQNSKTNEWTLIVNRPSADAPKRSSIRLTARFPDNQTRTLTLWVISQN